MRVLWFSSLSFNQKKDDKYFYPGGNWIISLKELLEIDQNIELGIAFWGKEELVFEDNAGTKYYQITKKHTSKINRYYKNWCHEIGSDHQIESLTNTIRDFNPDIIQIFGTESVFGNIVKYTKIPLVIHLQGIINPCLNAWRFPGYKITSLIKSLNWIYFLKGFGLYHDYFLFKKMAKRELEIYSLMLYFDVLIHVSFSLFHILYGLIAVFVFAFLLYICFVYSFVFLFFLNVV